LPNRQRRRSIAGIRPSAALQTIAAEGLAARDRTASEVIRASRERAVALGVPDRDAFWEALEASLDAHVPLFFRHMVDDGGTPDALPEESERFARVAVRSGVALSDLVQLLRTVQAPIFARAGELLAAGDFGPEVGAEVLRFSTAYMDWFAAGLTATYEREREAGDDHRVVLVDAVLGGGTVDASRLGYDVDVHHLAIAAQGPGARAAVLAIARELDRHVLCVQPEDDTAWGWLGSRRAPEPAPAPPAARPGVRIGLGSAAEGAEGFRRTHREALVALERAAPGQVVPYREIALEALLLRDREAARALVREVLAPLGDDERGERLRTTLRAVFATGNGASAAPVLGVSPRTVTHRIAEAESLLGAPLHSRHTELDLALRLEAALAREQ
jgi:hypothetical protein